SVHSLLGGSSPVAYLTNSILTAVPYLGSGAVAFDHCATASSSAGFYASAGAGNFYLAPFSTNRGAGTTLVNPTLLAALKQKTSYPPVIYSNITISTNLILSPQAQRNTAAPDIGFLYDPIDYLTDVLAVTNSALIVAPG